MKVKVIDMRKEKCCEKIKKTLDFECKEQSPFDCLDALIYYSEQFDEYGIIVHDGGQSYVKIDYCPWCGTKLPDSKRELWFNELERKGYENPFEDEIPEEFKSNKWWDLL